MITRRNLLMGLGGVGAALSIGEPARAQSAWQAIAANDISLVVAYGAGGSTDAAARLLNKKFNSMGLKTKVVNRPGSGGVEGTGWTRRQPPTGAVILAGSPTAMLFLPSKENTGYTWRDFEPIGLWSSAAFGFSVHAESKYKTMADAIKDAQARPGQVSVGSTGSGGEYQYLIEQVFAENKTRINYIGYRGGGDVSSNLLGRHIDIGYISIAGASPLARDNKIRILAHTSEVSEKLSAFPDVPHIGSVGSKQKQISFYALFAPKGTPRTFRDALTVALQEASKDPEFIADHDKLGLTVKFMNASELNTYMEEIEKTIIPHYKAWNPG